NKANSNDFIIKGFESATTSSTPNPSPIPSPSKPISDYYSQIATKLDAVLSNIISVGPNDYDTATSSISSDSITNNLITAAKAALLLEIQGANIEFYFGTDATYTAQDVVNSIDVILPSSSNLDSSLKNGKIPGVQLELGKILLTNTAKTNTFTIEFTKGNSPTPKKTSPGPTKNKMNQQIANELSDILSNIINVQGYSSTLANASLSSPSQEAVLIIAIQQALILEIQKSGQTFSFKTQSDDINYSVKQIVDNIDVKLPSSSSITQDDINNGQIPGVVLEYQGILLNNTKDTNTFIVEGFQSSAAKSNPKKSNSNEPEKVIANELDNLLSSQIAVNGYKETEASDALATQTAKDALIKVIQTALLQEIEGSGLTFTYPTANYTITYTPQQVLDNITIILPTTQLSSNDNALGQIPGVSLKYGNTLLSNTSGT
ncbi:hypothetical protein IKS57_04330, partial [bacterium]|nr:hypothetical protein [bacterium]